MTRAEFIMELVIKGYAYEKTENKIIITHKDKVWLDSMEEIPAGVEFRNKGEIRLNSLKFFSERTKLNNSGKIYLHSIKEFPSDIEFGKNITDIRISNKWLSDYQFDINGINKLRYFSLLIKKGLI
jgi:hypothetical protein